MTLTKSAPAPARRALAADGAPSRFSPGAFAPWLVALMALAAVWGYWLLSARVKYRGDLTGHINVGQPFLGKSREKFQPRVQIQKHVGFDGQFFLYLACDPFLRRASTIQRLDAPALRARRIGYPLLVWALARGQARPAPWIMFWVCAAGIATATGLLAAMLRRSGASPYLALLFPASYTAIMSFHWLTSESLALALVAASVFLLQAERPVLSLLMAMAAGLTKEVTLLWPLAVALHGLATGDRRRAALFCLAPLPVALWTLQLRFGLHLSVRAQDDAKNLSLPFVGAARRLAAILQGHGQGRNSYPVADGLMITAILAAPFAAAFHLWRDRSPEAIALALAALISISLPAREEFWAWNNYTRQSFLLVLFLFIVSARAWPRARLLAALTLLASGAGVAFLAQYLSVLV